MQTDSHVVATLYKQHKKAKSSAKLVSLYLFDAVAREARARVKKAAKESKGKAGAAAAPVDSPANGSTTPGGSPAPVEGSGAVEKKGDGTNASLLKKLEGVAGKVVLINWEDGEEQHKVRPPYFFLPRFTDSEGRLTLSRPSGESPQSARHLEQSRHFFSRCSSSHQLEIARGHSTYGIDIRLDLDLRCCYDAQYHAFSTTGFA